MEIIRIFFVNPQKSYILLGRVQHFVKPDDEWSNHYTLNG